MEFPPIWPDEVLFYSPSLDFAEHGTLRTQVLEGLIRGMDQKTLWMPPLFFILNGWWIKIFGFEIESLRLFASVTTLASVWMFWVFLQSLGFSVRARFGACLLLSTDLLFLRVGWTARMEALCLFFSILSLYILSRNSGIANQTKSNLTYWEGGLAGLSLGISFLAHPFAAVFGIPSLFLIHKRKGWKIWTYWFGGLIPIVAWGVLIYPDWELFIYQFGLQFGRKTELFKTFSPITKIKVLLGGYETPGIRLLFYLGLALGVWVIRKEFFEKSELAKFFLIWVFSILGFLLLSTEYYYVMYLCLPISAIGGFFFERIRSRRVQYFAAILIFCNIFILFYAYRKIGFANSNFDLKKNFTEAMIPKLKGSQKIYLQAIPDPYFTLSKELPGTKILEFIPGELPIPPSDFLATLETVDAFVISVGQKRNEYVDRFLQENHAKFRIVSVSVEPSGARKLVKAEAQIYLKK
ncbi:UDP phosphate-alpha-4-amino-4-deoxy-L- arabinose arabinosyl transferase [Leptospira perolatii]|uniref:UDP phosphate-alpha-4-amino-4-deoxy-L-arabinose arabinosyl transferase n=1 Tax=Leptospira perolatii TaxID=2023191 RepID=A0A2M9ZTA3_9LEPT|nr:UDP phosphate-alpha-4-amino-4-deoxy-L- arabinose arabinosyl transferase [Leptospira perolatii]PJZ75211.1 UDP phosphate-alpha-4-amino-4-deoxy-L- arabinose arabinosyl transferase [Leptospira perolatii]